MFTVNLIVVAKKLFLGEKTFANCWPSRRKSKAVRSVMICEGKRTHRTAAEQSGHLLNSGAAPHEG